MLQSQATLVDLLDRVLDRGLIINADVVIMMAGVPLIGLNLRAALASMETMTRYGMMVDWDRSIRAKERSLPVHFQPVPQGVPEPSRIAASNGQEG
jgi:hypothetical protein